MIIELLLMSKDELYFGVCCFKDAETCTACHCRWFYFCAALVVVFAGFLPLPFILLLTCSLWSTDVVKHHKSSHRLCCWECPAICPGGELGKGIFPCQWHWLPLQLAAGALPRTDCQPGTPAQGSGWNRRAVFSTWRWYFRPVLLQLSRVDK